MAKQQKHATKGMKKIVADNKETLYFYRNLAFGASAVYVLVMFLWLKHFYWMYYISTICCTAIYICCYRFMKYMSIAHYGNNGQLLDSGVDLNMEGGFSENVKDLMIITAGCQLLSLISDLCWLLWSFVPVRLMWLFWYYALKPYVTQPVTPSPAAVTNDKKTRQGKKASARRH